MLEKRYLFTPGPTPVPDAVLREMSAPIIHHRPSMDSIASMTPSSEVATTRRPGATRSIAW